ncbi:TatD family hydrolase [Parvularcula lutaonensis]|uniref:TatD family hydrolase n=1 Tax=Parvularcula lutaonensis TaxID=491923 RepID=A0ABV7MBK2_9PROT|nr:TatD family hydrolase [Parvularcula lutaonensis]GGY40819.1 LuxR family transcriptional regulator [Parvularcula lutaonensis]
MFVDSHVNLHGEKYEDDLDEVLQRAEEAGVGAMLLISDRLESVPAIAEIAERSPAFTRSVGVHPHHAKDFGDLTAERLIELAHPEKVVGIGECGLDYYYEYSDRDVQRRVFAAHIAASQETGLPLIIHTRDADEDMQRMLEEAYKDRPFPFLLHCYTSGRRLMEAGLEMGGYVAFSGIVTFKRADEVRALAKDCPLDRLLIETDCPYLAPVPYRGRRNEPAYVIPVAEKLAEIRGEPLSVIEEATTENFFRLFERAPRP